MGLLQKARDKARNAHEALYYEGLCTVAEYQEVTDSDTKLTHHEEVTTLENQPCNLSFSSVKAVDQTDTAAIQSQSVKLFIAPEIEIKPGSKITVTQNGQTTAYKSSGKPAIYSGHQEIMLELFEGWA